MFKRNSCSQGCFNQTTRREQRSYTPKKKKKTNPTNSASPKIEDALEFSSHTMPFLPPFFSSSQPLSLYVPLSRSLSEHIEAPLCCFAPSPFRMQRRGPREGLPLALQLNREDGVIRTLPGGCQLVLGRADRVACWWMRVHARLPAPSPHGHLLCVERAAEFVCGCILILHLLGSGHAWPSKPASLCSPCLY